MFALGRKVRTFERVWKWTTWHIFLSRYMLKNMKYLEHWPWFIGFPPFLTPKKYPKQVTAPMDTPWVWQTQGRPPPWAAGREGFGHLDARPSGTNWPTWNRSCSVKTIAAVISKDCSPIFWVQDLFLWVIPMKHGILKFFSTRLGTLFWKDKPRDLRPKLRRQYSFFLLAQAPRRQTQVQK